MKDLLTPEEIMKDVIWSAMTCSYKNALEHPGEGLLNFYTPESFVALLENKLAQLAKVQKVSQSNLEVIGTILMKLLVGLGMVREDAEPTYPELIMATEEYLECQKARLDRPELIKEMNDILNRFSFRVATNYPIDNKAEALDQLLALYPDVDEARKSVAEEIKRELTEYGIEMTDEGVYIPFHDEWDYLEGSDRRVFLKKGKTSITREE